MYRQLQNNPKPIEDKIKKVIADKKIDFWLLVYMQKDGIDTYYKLNKEQMEKVATESYLYYYHHAKHREKTHYAVSAKSGKLVIMLRGNSESDPDLLKDFKI